MNGLLARPEVAAAAAVDAQYRANSALARRYGARGRARCLTDTLHTTRTLGVALAFDSEPLFRWYAGWVALLFDTVGVERSDLIDNLDALEAAARDVLPPTEHPALARIVQAGKDAAAAAAEIPSHVALDDPEDAVRERFLDAQLAGDRRAACAIVAERMAARPSVSALIRDVLRPCQLELGRRWHRGEVSVAQEHVGTAVAQLALATACTSGTYAPRRAPRILAVCPEGELHELALRMAAEQIEEGGYDVHYVGASTPSRALSALASDLRPAAVVASVSLSENLPALVGLIDALRAGAADVPVLVGGLPFEIDAGIGPRVGANAVTLTAGDALTWLDARTR